MPVVFRHRGFRFFFFSNEGNPREPVHVHVEGGGGEAKIWIRPDVHVACEKGYDRKTLAELVWIVRKERGLIERKWHEHFG